MTKKKSQPDAAEDKAAKTTAIVKRDPAAEAIEPTAIDPPAHQTAALARRPDVPTDIDIAAVQQKFRSIAAFQALVQRSLKEDLDYGVIPGTKKKTLLKPGAEKIAKLLDLADLCEETDKIEDWEKPFFKYDYKVRLVSLLTSQTVSEGIGSCNSMESKYRWRWVREAELPKGIDKAALKTKGAKRTVFEPQFALDKQQTDGKYGKPEEYWRNWQAAIETKRAKPARRKLGAKEYDGFEMVMDDAMYQLPNDDIYSQVNTIKKMAKKRALVDAALSVGRLSDLFTQDLEDFVAAEGEGGEARDRQPLPEKETDDRDEHLKSPGKPKATPKPASASKPPASQEPEDDGGPPLDDPSDDDPGQAGGVGGGGGEEEGDGDDLATLARTGGMGEKEHKAHLEHVKVIKFVLERQAPDVDYKDFKRFLFEVQNAPKNKGKYHFVGEKFGNLSLEDGDPKDVNDLMSHMDQMIDQYINKRMKGGQRGKGNGEGK